MNRSAIITKLSHTTGLEPQMCGKVLDTLENILSEELENSKGVFNAFEKMYKLIQVLKK